MGYGISIWDVGHRYVYLPYRYGHRGYRHGIWANDMGDDNIDVVILENSDRHWIYCHSGGHYLEVSYDSGIEVEQDAVLVDQLLEELLVPRPRPTLPSSSLLVAGHVLGGGELLDAHVQDVAGGRRLFFGHVVLQHSRLPVRIRGVDTHRD
jgi:hypothetical protein